MKILSILVTFFLLANTARAQQKSLESVSVKEFLEFPENYQAMYLAGALDGISFVTYSHKFPDHSSWVSCVRKTTLAETLSDLKTLYNLEPSELENPIPWAVAKVIGNRNCER